MNPGFLTRSTPPWMHLMSGEPTMVADLLSKLRENELPGVVVRQLRGSKMRTRDALLDEFSAALQFPYYFGDNWNALDECLNDLEWLSGSGYVLCILDVIDVLAAEGGDQLELLGALFERTGEEWATPIALGEAWDRPARPFHVLLHCEPGKEREVSDRLQRAGWTLQGPVITLAESAKAAVKD